MSRTSQSARRGCPVLILRAYFPLHSQKSLVPKRCSEFLRVPCRILHLKSYLQARTNATAMTGSMGHWQTSAAVDIRRTVSNPLYFPKIWTDIHHGKRIVLCEILPATPRGLQGARTLRIECRRQSRTRLVLCNPFHRGDTYAGHSEESEQ